MLPQVVGRKRFERDSEFEIVVISICRSTFRPETAHATWDAANSLLGIRPTRHHLFDAESQARSKRSRFMTFSHAPTKSCTNFSLESSHA